jgi:hypothetical protein
MPLSAGDKLGPYEILALVYRARDSRLNRDVAIKVSNAQFTAAPRSATPKVLPQRLSL